MASDSCGKASDEVLSLLCKGCDKTFDSKKIPLLLPCLHSFCKPCLEKFMKKEEADHKIACPTCNDRFPLPKNIDLFPVNLRLSHLAKTAAIENQAKSGKVKCQKCENSPKDATTFLYNRSKFLCDQCTSGYKRFDDNEELVFIDLSACEKGDFKTYQPPSQCLKHKKQDHVLYCVDCKKLICVVCGQTEHSQHDKRSIEDTAADEKKALEELTNGVDDALQAMDKALRGIEDMKDKVKVSVKKANKKIDEACDQLKQTVENRRKALKKKCQEIGEGKDDVLSNQMISIERLKRNLAFAQLYAKDTIGNQYSEEILSIKKHIEDRLKRVKELYDRESMDLSEDDLIETSLETRPIVKKINLFGSFPKVPDHRNCTSDALNPVQTIVGKTRIVNVTLKDELKAMVTGMGHFQHQLTKVGEDPDEYIPPKVTITQDNNKDRTAILGFTPDQPGEYELTIMVRNKPIADPYKITAIKFRRDYKPFQNEPVIAYKEVGGTCYGVAVHDNGTVYALNYDGKTIKVFKVNGEESNFGNNRADRENFVSPRSIAFIGDTIYVVGNIDHSMKMYSTDGMFIRGLGTGSGSGDGQFNNPQGICTDGRDRVYVADHGNKRIQAFSSDGTFIKHIPCSTQPYDVAIDPDGNIHVALYSNKHIGIYSPQDGRQLQTYNLGGNLKCPTGIYIDCEGNRLIACGSDNIVYIGDSKDTLLASKQINKVYCITMHDGLIYIAEADNKRVSVY